MLRSPLLPLPCHLSHSPLCYLNRSTCDPQPGTFKNTTSNHPTRNFTPMALLWPRTTSTINATSAKMASTMPKVIGTSITLCIGHIAWTAAPPGMAVVDVSRKVGRVKLLRGVFFRSVKTTAGTMNFILGDDVNDSEGLQVNPTFAPVSFQNFLLKLQMMSLTCCEWWVRHQISVHHWPCAAVN